MRRAPAAMINALPISLHRRRDRWSLQSDEVECLFELGECEFPGWVELESEEKADEGDTSGWKIDI